MDIADYVAKGAKNENMPKSHFSLNNEIQLIKSLVTDFSQKDFFNICEVIT